MARALLTVVILAFVAYCFVDVSRTDRNEVRNLPKLAWIVVTLVFPVVGGVAWLLTGKPKGQAGRGGPRRGPLGPDDDPDFLRGI